jgi:DNA-directed RNA polymerase specialized sigma24 family protein
MAEDDPFADLIRRVRTGDAEAAAELVRQFEPEIRRRVRNWLRLHGPELRSVFESMDVCQSVLADFFTAGSTGQYDLDRPERVLALLTTMARNKLKVLSRDQHRQRRDVRRTQPLDSDAGGQLVEPSASRVVATRELLNELRNRLTDEERCLADLRAGGSSWNEIATMLGGTPDSRRKQYARAFDRVARELGLDPQLDDLP